MHVLVISLIACGCAFNCCAIAFLLWENRKRDLQKKTFKQNLNELDYHLDQARSSRMPRIKP